MKVRITKCSEGTYWYHDKIGEVFEVYDSGTDRYRLDTNANWPFIDKDDCEIVKETKMKVRVTKASRSTYWYAKKIGEVFEVEDVGPADYQLYIKDTRHYIERCDCEPVEKPVKKVPKKGYLEQLLALRKVTEDGDLICKRHRDELVKCGYVARYNGYNFITVAGVEALSNLNLLGD